MELSPDRKEIIRYLGYHGVSPDEEVLREIELCVEQLQKAVTPRYVYEKFPLSRSRGQNSEEQLCFAGITVASRNLSANLQGCSAVYLMAVTLGSETERLLRTAQARSMGEAVILDAAAGAAVENVCDNLCRDLEAQFSPRFLF